MLFRSDALVKWKNLTPIQDPGRVYTIADYKNKQYRYTMSEYAVEIERLTVRLENIFLESGNLSTNFFVRLEKSLADAEAMENTSLKEVNEWWSLLQEDFKRLNHNYQDYLRDFYSGKTDRLMKSVEFIIHKDKFIKYLNEFVQELQHHSRRIEQILVKNSIRIGVCKNGACSLYAPGQFREPRISGRRFPCSRAPHLCIANQRCVCRVGGIRRGYRGRDVGA